MADLEWRLRETKRFLVPLVVIAVIGTAYLGVREYVREQRDALNLKAHNETMACYLVRGTDHHECWNTRAAQESKSYGQLYDDLTFWE